MTNQEWQKLCVANQIGPLGALAVLSIVGCLLPRDHAPLTQADGYAESYPNGCPIIPESND